jgi:shikimate kinase
MKAITNIGSILLVLWGVETHSGENQPLRTHCIWDFSKSYTQSVSMALPGSSFEAMVYSSLHACRYLGIEA